MSEQRFVIMDMRDDDGGWVITDTETREVLVEVENEHQVWRVCRELNEQQATIQSLKEDKAIAEDYANIFEKENVKLRKKLNNYKATVLGFLFIMEENGRISGKDDNIVKDLFKLIDDE